MEKIFDIISAVVGTYTFGSLFYLVYMIKKQDKEFAEREKAYKSAK